MDEKKEEEKFFKNNKTKCVQIAEEKLM